MSSSQFYHRVNSDGTIDAICRSCFLTAATVENETDLQELEMAHRCPNKTPFVLTEDSRILKWH
jgi:hypothetical protein